MAWTNITASEVAVDAPVDTALVTALRDNATYAWQGHWHPYDMTYPGDGATGEVYGSGDGSLASIDSPDFADGFEYRFVWNGVVVSASALTTIQFYRETDAALSSTVTIASSTPDDLYGYTHVILPRRSALYGQAETLINNLTKTTIGRTLTNVQQVLRVRFNRSSGTFQDTGGNLVMLRRREQLTGV